MDYIETKDIHNYTDKVSAGRNWNSSL